MNILSKIIIATSLTLATANAASAACNVNYRQYEQQVRIFRGAVYGSVRWHEFQRLQAGQARVRQLERMARADGHITGAECVLLNTALNTQSFRIYRKKHN